jgi:hypothetical protein
MKYIVNCSGGLTSFEALRRTLDAHGKENTHAYFADTKQEDTDLYRFLRDQERYFGIEIERICDGRTIWQTWKDRKCITLRLRNGAEVAPCSLLLKREAIDRVVTSRYKTGEYVRVFGYEWSEIDRMSRLEEDIAPEKAWFPLAERPFVDKCHISQFLDSIGIAVPRLYLLGFEHNNCGGGCVKAGQAHWAHLWFTLPERYLMWEEKEEEFRQYIKKDIAILKDRRGGQSKPMTLRAFRLRLEAGDTDYDKSDWGGCGCFAPVAQLRMEELLLTSDVAGREAVSA